MAIIGGGDGVLRLWKADGSVERTFEGVYHSEVKFSWSPDGRRIACGHGADGKQVRIVNLDGTPGPVFKGHEERVKAVAWSPDGKQLVSSSDDGTARIWNEEGTSGPVLKGHESYLRDVAWSPDGKWIVSAGGDSVRLWKPDGTAGPVIPCTSMDCSRWHPDSRRFVVMGPYNHQYLAIYDLEGKLVRHLQDISGGGAAAWSPDGKQLVAGDADGNLLVWDDKGRRLRSLAGGAWLRTTVAWSSTGQLASKTGDGTLTFWTADGEPVRTVKDATGGGWGLRWSPDAQYLLSAGRPNMQLWNADGTRGRTIYTPGMDVAWSPDCRQFAALYDKVHVFDLDTRERQSWDTGDLQHVGLSWSADGRWLAQGGGPPESVLRLWTPDGKAGPVMPGQAFFQGEPFHPKEPLLATLHPKLRLWRIGPPRVERGQARTKDVSNTVVRAPDDLTAADGGQKSEGETGAPDITLVWSQDWQVSTYTPCLAWSPDGQWLACDGYSGFLRLWNVDGRRGCSLRGQMTDPESLSWGPDSRHLAVGLSDEKIMVYDAQTGQTDWVGVHLPAGEAAVFNEAGRLLRGQDKMNLLDQHLAYVVEHPDGRMEVVKPSQFPARAAELARQVTAPEWAKPVPTLPDGSIDLMPLVEIKPDAKPETDWTRDGQTLVAAAGKPLPIPITLSGDYDFVVQAEVPDRVEGLHLLLQADGHPCESVLCAAGHISGLQLIDGQQVGQNESVLRQSLLGQGQKFQLTCQVRRKQIRMLLDDRTIVEWKGEFDRLSAGGGWGTVAGDGLFGLLGDAPYLIREMKLIPRSETAKQPIGDRSVAENLREMGCAFRGRLWNGQTFNNTREPPPGFFRISYVQTGLLYDADVPSLAPLLAALPELSVLDLGWTDVSDEGLRHLRGLNNLRSIHLAGTLVRNPLVGSPIDKTQLHSLNLNATDLLPEAFDEIGKCPMLSGCLLSGTQMSDDRLLRLGVLTNVQDLVMSDNPLELGDEVIKQLARFAALRALYIERIPAAEDRLMRLAQLTQVTGLWLSGTKTTDRVLAELQKMPNLCELAIKSTPATEAGVKAFKAARPNCQVDWSPAP